MRARADGSGGGAAAFSAARRLLVPFAAPSGGLFLSGCLALALATLLALAVPFLLRRIIDDVIVGGQQQHLAAAVLSDEAALRSTALNCGLAALAFVARHAASFFGHVALVAAAEASCGRLRSALLARAHALPVASLAAAGATRVGAVMARDADAFKELLSDGLNKVVHASIYAVGGLLLCFRIDLVLTLAVAAAAGCVGTLGKRLGARRRTAAARCAAAAADAAALAAESLAVPRLVKAFGAESAEGARYAAAEARSLDAVSRAELSKQAGSNAAECIGRLVLCAVIGCGALRVRSGALSAGDLVSFSYYCLEVGGAVDKLVANVGKAYAALGASRRVLALLDAPAEFDEALLLSRQPLWVDSLAPAVEFEGVHFAYGPRAGADGFVGELGEELPMSPKSAARAKAVLRGVTLSVLRGEVVSLVGPSGGGKSTLLDLVARFVEPSEGTVCVSGVDVRASDPTELRASIGWVQQGAALTRGTVADNIRFGRPEATDEEVRAAAAAAGADTFIETLEGGYAHRVSREGGGISGGQAARVAVARALLRRPRLLLLDEPTAALDAVSESELVESLLRRCRQDGITVLMVHHRIAAARHADRIALLQNGRVEAVGTHAQLLADQGGAYFKMCKAQDAK